MTDLVFLPCARPTALDDDVAVLLSEPRPGTTVLAAWTSLGRLVGACGTEQPWVAVPVSAAADVRDAAGAEAVVLDPPAATVAWA